MIDPLPRPWPPDQIECWRLGVSIALFALHVLLHELFVPREPTWPDA